LEQGTGPIYIALNRVLLDQNRAQDEMSLFDRLSQCCEPVVRNPTFNVFRCDRGGD
jgi:hypothetical protein